MSPEASVPSPQVLPRLKKAWLEKGLPELMKRRAYRSPYAVPQLKTIVINMGVSEARENIKALDVAAQELAVITGQKPSVRRAKKSISNFKLRQGMPIGLVVTLRGARMYEFLDRLIVTALPRLRDFRGLEPGSFDGHGNYNLGLREHHIFPEVDLDKSDKARGLNISFVTTARTDAEAQDVLSLLGLPFRKREK